MGNTGAANTSFQTDLIPRTLTVNPLEIGGVLNTPDAKGPIIVTGTVSGNDGKVVTVSVAGQQVSAPVNAQGDWAAMAEVAARAPLVPLSGPPAVWQMDVQGLFVPNPARIEGLGRADLGALHRCGALALLQVQAVSMHHLPFLAAAEARLDQPSPYRPPEASAGLPGGDAALSGFLEALAQSRDRDVGGWGPTAGEKTVDINTSYTVPR